MTSCAEWREQLADHALGLPASAALAEHLACCPNCSRALAEWRARTEEIDAGIRRVVNADPSPYLSSRVMALIHSAPFHAGRTSRWRAALVPLSVLVLVATLVFVVRATIVRRERAAKLSSIAAEISSWRSPTESLLRSPSEPLLKTLPRLGESLFDIEVPARPSGTGKGEKNAQ